MSELLKKVGYVLSGKTSPMLWEDAAFIINATAAVVLRELEANSETVDDGIRMDCVDIRIIRALLSPTNEEKKDGI